MKIFVHALGSRSSNDNKSDYTHIEVSPDNNSIQLKVPLNLKPYNIKESSVSCERANEFLNGFYSSKQVYDSRLSDFINKQMVSAPSDAIFFSYGPDSREKEQLMFGEAGVFENTLLDIINDKGFEVSVTALEYFHDRGMLEDLIEPSNTITSTVDRRGNEENNATTRLLNNSEEAIRIIQNIRDNIQTNGKKSRESHYHPVSIVANIMISMRDQKHSIWIVQLACSQRVDLSIGVPKLSQIFEATHRELSAFANIFSSLSSGRLKIPYQKSRLGSIMKKSLSSSSYRVDAFLHVNDTVEHLIGEDACSISLFSKMTIGGIGNARSRDNYADVFIMECQNNRLEAELSIAAKVVPTFNSVKLKDGSSYQEQADKYISKSMDDINNKNDKERQQLVQEASEKAQEYLKQRAVDWQRQIDEYETEESIVINELNQFPEENQNIEEQLLLQITAIANQITEVQKDITEEVAAMVGLNREKLDLMESVKQFEDKLADFAAKFEGDQDTVAQKRDEKRNDWKQTQKQYDNERLSLNIEFSQSSETMLAFYDLFAGDSEDQTLISMDPSNELERALKELLMEGKQSDGETLSHLIEQCDTRKQQIDMASFQYVQSIEKVEKEAEEMNQQTEIHREKLRDELTRISLDKEQDIVLLKQESIKKIKQGIQLTKVPEKGKRKKQFYFVTHDKLCCCDVPDHGVVHREKLSKVIPLKNITKIILGQHTERFKSYLQRIKTNSESPAKGLLGRLGSSPAVKKGQALKARSVEEAKNEYYRSFSVILKKNKTLDLIAEDRDSFDAWVIGLVELLSIGASFGDTLNKASLTLLNQYHEFPDLLPEEVDLCSRIHVPPHSLSLIKHVLMSRKHQEKLTTYDVYYAEPLLNLLQAEVIYQFAVNHNWLSRSNSS